jgi:hypothetical protein
MRQMANPAFWPIPAQAFSVSAACSRTCFSSSVPNPAMFESARLIFVGLLSIWTNIGHVARREHLRCNATAKITGIDARALPTSFASRKAYFNH